MQESDLIKGMVISRLNQVGLSDITYIRIRTDFVYLAAILDAYFRKVIGYAVSTRLDTALTLGDVTARLPYFFEKVYNQKAPRQTLLTLSVQSQGCSPSLCIY